MVRLQGNVPCNLDIYVKDSGHMLTILDSFELRLFDNGHQNPFTRSYQTTQTHTLLRMANRRSRNGQ